MCGITGILNLKEKKAIDDNLLKQMTRIIGYRGPDQEGYYTDDYCGLGHRRLSILDLSERGKQPMTNEDGSIVIVFNGEIYNFQQIRDNLEQKGHKFNSNTDTETIIHGYEEYGHNIVRKLRGMFAFAIWDSKRKELFIARDRIGKKPLVYYKDADKFIFASEIKSLLQDKQIKREINTHLISQYLKYGFIPAPHSIIKGIYKLEPGHFLILSKGKLKISKYWDISFNNIQKNKSEDYYCEQIIKHLYESTKLRMISDVPLGAFLSGGVDSSAIVAMMSKISDNPIKTFTIGFNEEKHSELRYAKIVADKYKTDHEEIIIEPNAISILPELVWYYNEPFADISVLPSYYVAKATRKYVTVALNGDGGDENFAGYARYVNKSKLDYPRRIPPIVYKNILYPLVKKLPESRNNRLMNMLRIIKNAAEIGTNSEEEHYLRKVQIMDKGTINSISNEKISNNEDLILAQYHNYKTENLINKKLHIDMKTYLPNDILVKVDIATMANSLEGRSPFLDHKFMEFNSTIPPELKIKSGIQKYILKKALKPYLPKEILYRDKKGFGFPINEWFRNQFKDITEAILLSETCINRGYFKKDKVEEMINAHKKNINDNGVKLWSLLWLELWHRVYIDPEKVRKPITSIKKI